MKGGPEARIPRSWGIRGSRPPRSSTIILSPCSGQTSACGSRRIRGLKTLLKAIISMAVVFLLFSSSPFFFFSQSRIEFPARFSPHCSTAFPPFLRASSHLESAQQVQQVQRLPSHAQLQRLLGSKNVKSIIVPMPIMTTDDQDRLFRTEPESKTGASPKTLTNDTAEGYLDRVCGQGEVVANFQEKDSDDSRAAQKGNSRKFSDSLNFTYSRTPSNGSSANSRGKRISSSEFTQSSNSRTSSLGPGRSKSSSRRGDSFGGNKIPEKGVIGFDHQIMQEQQKFAVKSKINTWSQVENELLAAKRSISEATPGESVDPELDPEVYLNVSAFHKSYELMERMFRIYIYQEGDRRVVHTGPLTGIYCSEGKFIEELENKSVFVEQDPEKAHMFFLPYSVAQMVRTIYVEHTTHSNGTREFNRDGMAPLKEFVKDYVNEVAVTYKFWNRSHGSDHFFVACHDWGPRTTQRHEELRTNAVKVVCNADSNEEFVLGKDASLPSMNLKHPSRYKDGQHQPKLGGPGPDGRSTLAFFAGQMHGDVRATLIEHWKGKNYAVDDFKFYDHTLALRPVESEGNMTYRQHMKNSKYCICAAGYEVNSPRIVEAIYYDCVPVIIADRFVPPFSDVLDWSKFSVVVAEKDIPELRSILLRIPLQRYEAMQKRLSNVRNHFLWNDPPVKYDVFHMILHSVWTSRLNRLNLVTHS